MPSDEPDLMTIFIEALEAIRLGGPIQLSGGGLPGRRGSSASSLRRGWQPTQGPGRFLEHEGAVEPMTVVPDTEEAVRHLSPGNAFLVAAGNRTRTGRMGWRAPLSDRPVAAGADGFVPGQVIAGRYTLGEVLGEGGMGTVYRADQTSRSGAVALKLIKIGMDSRAVLARFDAERQALALMDHPNIARVYDGGTTAPASRSS